MMREIAEETGLTDAHLKPEPDWTAVLDGPKIALMRIMQAGEAAVDLRERIIAHIATERTPELVVSETSLSAPATEAQMNLPACRRPYDRACGAWCLGSSQSRQTSRPSWPWPRRE
jgi:hypothetical protein